VVMESVAEVVVSEERHGKAEERKGRTVTV
jgi:hypothetical protein